MIRLILILTAVLSTIAALGRPQAPPLPPLPATPNIQAQPVQIPPEPDYHDTLKPGDAEYNINPLETRVPPGHICQPRQVYEENLARTHRVEQRAHPCDCKMTCTLISDDDTGTQHEEPTEDSTCKTWCHINGRMCLCHTEEPCPGSHPSANALMDMDGKVVAMLKASK